MAQFYALDKFLSGARRLAWAAKSVSYCDEGFRLTRGARLKCSFFLVDVSGNVKRIALSVAETVNDGATEASLFFDRLLQRLRLAPVQFKITALRDIFGLLAGLKHFICSRNWARSPGNKPMLWFLWRPFRFVGVV